MPEAREPPRVPLPGWPTPDLRPPTRPSSSKPGQFSQGIMGWNHPHQRCRHTDRRTPDQATLPHEAAKPRTSSHASVRPPVSYASRRPYNNSFIAQDFRKSQAATASAPPHFLWQAFAGGPPPQHQPPQAPSRHRHTPPKPCKPRLLKRRPETLGTHHNDPPQRAPAPKPIPPVFQPPSPNPQTQGTPNDPHPRTHTAPPSPDAPDDPTTDRPHPTLASRPSVPPWTKPSTQHPQP